MAHLPPLPPLISFSRLGGEPQERGPGIGVFTATTESGPVAVYVLAECPAPGSHGHALAQAVAAAETAFKATRGSLTARLTAAVREASRSLRTPDRRPPTNDAPPYTVFCLAVQRDTAYWAQLGPSLIAHYRPGFGLLDGNGHHDPQPLANGRPSLRIAIGRQALAPGDRLILGSSLLKETLPPAVLEDILALPSEEALPHLYSLTRSIAWMNLLYLGPFPGSVSDPWQDGADPLETPANDGPSTARRPWPRPRWPQPATLQRALLLLALVLTLANIVLSALLVPPILQHRRQNDGADALARAQQLLTDARSTSDVTAARQALSEAMRLAQQAYREPPTRQDAALLLRALEEEQRTAHRVRFLRDVAVIADLYAAGFPKAQADRIAVARDRLYILDRGDSQVYEVPRTGDAPPQPVQFPQPWNGAALLIQVPPGPLNQAGSIIVMDRQRRFVELTSRGPQPIVVRQADALRSLNALAGYYGNLYVLDSDDNQVWRYLPSLRGYDSERKALLEAQDLRGALELAVNRDIFVLTSQGQLRRFVEGREVPFPQSELDTPLRRPSSLFLTGRTLYVADTGNDRIVAFDYEGRFLFQLRTSGLQESATNGQRGTALRSPRALWVDEDQGHILIAASSQVISATFPTGP